VPEIEKVGSTSLYDLYKNTGPSAIPIADSMAMKNTASGLHGAEPISLTAPNFYGSAIPYNSPSIFAPFVVGAHTHIVNKSIRAEPKPKTKPIHLETIIKRGHDWLVQEPNKSPRKLRPLDVLATCPSCNSSPIKWSDIRNKRLAKNTHGLRCNRQAKGKCDHLPAKMRSTKRKRKREEDLADSVNVIGLGGLIANNVVQAALNEASQSSTRKYEMLRAAFLPFLKALDPVTAARLLLDVIMSKRSKQCKPTAPLKDLSDTAQPAKVPHRLSANNMKKQPAQLPKLPGASNQLQEQQTEYFSQDQARAPAQLPHALAACQESQSTAEVETPPLLGDIDMPSSFTLCINCNACVSLSDHFCSSCGNKVNHAQDTSSDLNMEHTMPMQTAIPTGVPPPRPPPLPSSSSDPFTDVSLGVVGSAFF